METPSRTDLFLVIPILFAVLSMHGCVTKERFLTQVSQTQTLADQLKDERQNRGDLAKEATRLKKRIADLVAELAAAKEAAANTELRLKEDLAAREKQRDAAMEMGAIVERSLNDEIQRLNDAFAKEKALMERQRAEIAALRVDFEEKKRESDKLSEALLLTEDDLARMKREMGESSKAHQDLLTGLRQEIDAGNVKITQIKNRLSVEIVDKILFASGSDRITLEGKGVLEKVSQALKNVRENDIRIEGHTDNVPIGPKIINKFPSNWELSTARSTQVVRFLADHEVPPENMQAAGFSKYRAVDSNDTPEGKQRNRRIEIVLFPRDITRIVEGVN
ncbi:OmpA family protein [bacterium AH-315-L15]|nr:OmpA family protein [bacterium AH-315-L15]